MNSIYIVLGSNIEPDRNIPLALELLKNESGITVVRVSSTWRTKPVDTCCTDFLNTAALILSSLDHSSVKKNILAKIEQKLGRVRTSDKNAPRRSHCGRIEFCETGFFFIPLRPSSGHR